MTCNKIQAFLPDMLLDSARISTRERAEVNQHLAACPSCQNNWKELQSTMQVLDTWGAPDPSPYFDTRMMARLREEKNSLAPGWLERIRTRLLFDSNLHLRPVMVAACALLLIAGAGSYEGFVSLNATPPTARQTVSPTVSDLELLDKNAQTLQQMAAFEDTDATMAPDPSGSASN